MTQTERPQATLANCVRWAKDRLIDDVAFRMLRDDYSPNYAAMTEEQRESLRHEVAKFNRLMQLPEDAIESLALLAAAGYWNGAKDTYWEVCDPPARPEGVGDELLPAS